MPFLIKRRRWKHNYQETSSSNILLIRPHLYGETLSQIERSPVYPYYPRRTNFSCISWLHGRQNVGMARRVTQLAGSPFGQSRVTPPPPLVRQLFLIKTLWLAQLGQLGQGKTFRVCASAVFDSQTTYITYTSAAGSGKEEKFFLISTLAKDDSAGRVKWPGTCSVHIKGVKENNR